MRKLSENQLASLEALLRVSRESGAEWVSAAVWRQACPPGVSVSTSAMLKTRTVAMVKAGVSRNGKVIELYRPA